MYICSCIVCVHRRYRKVWHTNLWIVISVGWFIRNSQCVCNVCVQLCAMCAPYPVFEMCRLFRPILCILPCSWPVCTWPVCAWPVCAWPVCTWPVYTNTSTSTFTEPWVKFFTLNVPVSRNTAFCIAIIQRKTSNTLEVCTAPAFVP